MILVAVVYMNIRFSFLDIHPMEICDNDMIQYQE